MERSLQYWASESSNVARVGGVSNWAKAANNLLVLASNLESSKVKIVVVVGGGRRW